jgi:hypothetical protein
MSGQPAEMAVPGGARIGGVVADYRGPYQTVRTVFCMEDLAVVFQPESRQVVAEMMRVWR